MGRRILAVIAGAFAGFVTVAVVESGGHLVFPPPVGVDLADPQALKEIMELIPVGALISVLVAWGLGAFVGGITAASIAKDREKVVAGIVGGLQLAAGVSTMIMIPHPLWFMVVAVPLSPLAALGGGALVVRRRTKVAEDVPPAPEPS